MTGIAITTLAEQNLAQITGLTSNTVSSFYKDELGWRVAVVMTELKRFPDSQDVLATYECLLDDEGNLISYQRVQRFLREQLLQS